METKKILAILGLGLGLMAWSGQPCEAAPMGTAFTYQGRLIDNNEPANGLYGFEFKLYDSAGIGGIQQGSTVTVGDVNVIDGYFTVELDFGGGVFGGDERWLAIGVRQDSTPPPPSLYLVRYRR